MISRANIARESLESVVDRAKKNKTVRYIKLCGMYSFCWLLENGQTPPYCGRRYFCFCLEQPLYTQTFINQSFENITSIEHSLKLLHKFQSILQRESLKSDLDSKLNVIFQVRGYFQRHPHRIKSRTV